MAILRVGAKALWPFIRIMKVIAIDCVFVSVEPGGYDKPGRVTLVNSEGGCIYDQYIRLNNVSNYRTYETGLCPADLAKGKLLKNIQQDVCRLIKGCLLVGHNIEYQLKRLGLAHPTWNIRDTATYEPFHEIIKNKPNTLRLLASIELSEVIQYFGLHSYENALTNMKLYNKVNEDWEDEMDNGYSDSDDNYISGEEESVEYISGEEESVEYISGEEDSESTDEVMRVIAINCDEVRVGPDGSMSKAARVSLVDQDLNVIYSQFIRVHHVTDYRTLQHGIKAHTLASGKTLRQVQQEVSDLIRDCILVGYFVRFNLKILGLCHPDWNIRDLTDYPSFKKYGSPPKLNELARYEVNIQQRFTNSIEDAILAMKIYVKVSPTWEAYLQK